MLRKIPFETCAEILTRFDLSEAGAEAVQGTMSPEQAIDALVAAAELPDLVNFLGHALPPREGICWALAVTMDLSPALAGEVTDLVRSWVREPQEATRHRLMQDMEKLTSDSVLYWLCAAVAWNGSGGIGAADGPVVLPPPWLHSKALLGAIAIQMGRDQTALTCALKAVHSRGSEVASGGWPALEVAVT